MKYFDLHIHPVMKTMFKDKGSRISPWETMKVNDDLFGNALDSQASLGMVARVDTMNLICMPIYAPEMALMNQFILLLGSYFFKEIDHSRLKAMGKAQIDYPTVRKEERESLMTPAPQHVPDLRNKKVKLLKNFSEYNPDDKDTIHIVFCVEGAHNFYGPGNDDIDTNAMLDNMEALIKEGTLVLYITPAHLAPNVFANHAFGLKVFAKQAFLPKGDGLFEKPFPPNKPKNKKGCYDLLNLAHKYCVALDVKHMSLRARTQLYAHHETNFPDRPLFASHVGFTGFPTSSIAEYRTGIDRFIEPGFDYYKISYKRRPGYLANTHFNPTSINMYDEDILKILSTGGLIGLSMDVRIMGADGNKGDGRIDDKGSEYVSKEEIGEFNAKGGKVDRTVELNTKLATTTTSAQDEVYIMSAEDLKEFQHETADMLESSGNRYSALHLRHFINQLLHLCYLAEKHKLKRHPLTQVCIGSDFDGLIQALHCCPDVSALPHFASDLRAMLPACAAEAHIKLGMPVDEIVTRLFFDNAHDFMAQHFNKIKKGLYHQPGKKGK